MRPTLKFACLSPIEPKSPFDIGKPDAGLIKISPAVFLDTEKPAIFPTLEPGKACDLKLPNTFVSES